MKKILWLPALALVLAVGAASSAKPAGSDDVQAGKIALKEKNYDLAISLFSKALASEELTREKLVEVYGFRGLAWKKKGDLDKAIADYSKALDLDPKPSTNYYNRGNAWQNKGDHDRAIADYTKVLEIDPQDAEACNARGLAWKNKGDLEKAVADYTRALEIDPKYATAYFNRGAARKNMGNFGPAIADFTKAIDLDPKDAEAYNARGLAWRYNGDDEKAVADYTKALEIDPKYSIACFNRGKAWENRKNYAQAVADYARALEIDPQDAYAGNDLASLLAACPDGSYRDGRRAVEVAEKASKLKDAASILDTLAAAYAESGRFPDAIKTQERAIAKLKREGGTRDLPGFETRLSLYKSGQPWRKR